MAINGDHGFTLIELLVALTIMVGLAAAFPLALDRLQPQRQVGLYAERVATDLRGLHESAMTSGRAAEIDASPGAAEYRLLPGDASRQLPSGLSLTLHAAEAPSPAVGRLLFYPDGSTTGGSVVVSRGDRSVSVRVGAFTGRVDVE